VPSNYPLTIYRGDTARWQFRLWADAAKTSPVDLTEATVKSEIRSNSGSVVTPLLCAVTLPNTIDVELSSVRRTAGRDFITVTNTFTDTKGERVHTLHTTVVGVTAEDIDAGVKTAVQNAMMHDMNILDIAGLDAEYEKEVRPEGEIRIADDATRTPGTPAFEDVKVGDALPAHHTRLSRGDLVNYAGVAGDANPIHWDEDIAKLAGLPDVIAHGMLTMGVGAGFASAWSGDPGAVTRYAVRLSQPAIVSATEGADIEFSGRIKSLDPTTRSGVVIVAAKSDGRKIFGLATLNIRFR